MSEEDPTSRAGVYKIAVLGAEEEGEGEGRDRDSPTEGGEYIDPFADEEEGLVCICLGRDGYDGRDGDEGCRCKGPLARG